MADPFSVVAGIVGVAAVTAHTARRLKEFLDSINDGPEAVRSISSELGILQCSLTALEDLLSSSDDLTDAAQSDEGGRCVASLDRILANCQHTLGSIHNTIKPFVEKRDGSKDFKWKTMAGWITRKDVLDSLKRELINAKMTLDLAVTFATFLCTRAGISQLQTQFTQLNTRLEEASEDNVSDVGSASVVTDLGFALKRFLRDPDPGAAATFNPLLAIDEDKPDILPIYDRFAGPSLKKVYKDDLESRLKATSRPKREYSSDSEKVWPTTPSPADSPSTQRASSNPLWNVARRLTPSTIQASEQASTKLSVDYGSVLSATKKLSSTNQGRLSGDSPLELKSTALPPCGTGLNPFDLPLKLFSDYFELSHKKMMNKSPSSMLNFGIVTAKPISNSPIYAENRTGMDLNNNDSYLSNQINDPKLYRYSSPTWILKTSNHSVSGKSLTSGVKPVYLSKVVTNGLSYDFIRLFVVAQKPQNNTAYNFQWKSFCSFAYVGPPRRAKDIGTIEGTGSETVTTAEITSATVQLAIEGDKLVFRLTSDVDRHTYSPLYTCWSIDPSVMDG